MKNLFVVLCWILVGISAATSQGQNHGGFSLSGGLLIAPKDSEDKDDNSQTGYNAGASIDFALGHMATFRMSVDYSSIPFNGEEFLRESGLSQYGVQSIDADPPSVLTVFGSLEIFFNENRRGRSGYLTLGAGYFNFSMQNIAIQIQGYRAMMIQEFTIEAIALKIGVGVEFPMGDGASFYVETSLCAAFAKAEVIPFVPTKGGLRVKI